MSSVFPLNTGLTNHLKAAASERISRASSEQPDMKNDIALYTKGKSCVIVSKFKPAVAGVGAEDEKPINFGGHTISTKLVLEEAGTDVKLVVVYRNGNTVFGYVHVQTPPLREKIYFILFYFFCAQESFFLRNTCQ
jgi:hypothetical protein